LHKPRAYSAQRVLFETREYFWSSTSSSSGFCSYVLFSRQPPSPSSRPSGSLESATRGQSPDLSCPTSSLSRVSDRTTVFLPSAATQSRRPFSLPAPWIHFTSPQCRRTQKSSWRYQLPDTSATCRSCAAPNPVANSRRYFFTVVPPSSLRRRRFYKYQPLGSRAVLLPPLLLYSSSSWSSRHCSVSLALQ
jgi:hypothetical protein